MSIDINNALERIESRMLLMRNYVASYRAGTVIEPKDPVEFMRTMRHILDRDIRRAG